VRYLPKIAQESRWLGPCFCDGMDAGGTATTGYPPNRRPSRWKHESSDLSREENQQPFWRQEVAGDSPHNSFFSAAAGLCTLRRGFQGATRQMPLMRRVRPEALDWLEEAKADFRHAMEAYRAGSDNWACLVAEQAAEKAIKAFLIGVLRKRPIHTRDLTVLHRQTRGRLKMPASTTNALAELSAYCTGARYPNSGLNRPSLSITAVQAGRAMRTARGVLAVVKRETARSG